MHPGQNVGLGKDYTLYSLIEGVVVFERRSQQQQVKVVPFVDYVVPAGLCITEGSRKWRRLEAAGIALAE